LKIIQSLTNFWSFFLQFKFYELTLYQLSKLISLRNNQLKYHLKNSDLEDKHFIQVI